MAPGPVSAEWWWHAARALGRQSSARGSVLPKTGGMLQQVGEEDEAAVWTMRGTCSSTGGACRCVKGAR